MVPMFLSWDVMVPVCRGTSHGRRWWCPGTLILISGNVLNPEFWCAGILERLESAGGTGSPGKSWKSWKSWSCRKCWTFWKRWLVLLGHPLPPEYDSRLSDNRRLRHTTIRTKDRKQCKRISLHLSITRPSSLLYLYSLGLFISSPPIGVLYFREVLLTLDSTSLV